MERFVQVNVLLITILYTIAAFIFWHRAIVDKNGYTLHRVFIGTFSICVAVAYGLVLLGFISVPLPIVCGLVLVLLGGCAICLAALTIGGYRQH